jgi:hypothetical protein
VSPNDVTSSTGLTRIANCVGHISLSQLTQTFSILSDIVDTPNVVSRAGWTRSLQDDAGGLDPQ